MQKHGCIIFVMEVLSMLEHFCSMVGKIFCSELTMNDMRGQGTVSCQEVCHQKYNSTSSDTIRSRKVSLKYQLNIDYPKSNILFVGDTIRTCVLSFWIIYLAYLSGNVLIVLRGLQSTIWLTILTLSDGKHSRPQ